MIEKYGYRRIYCMSPKVSIANPLKNVEYHEELLSQANEPFISLFPELSIAGYTCEDLFFNNDIKKNVNFAVEKMIEISKKYNTIIVFGLPFELEGRLYNAAMILYNGEIKGVVPKTFLPNYGEFYEMRWFSAGKGIHKKIKRYNQEFDFTSNQLFDVSGVKFGVEICEDLWAINQPSNNLAIAGAEIILNLSASNELVKKHEYRKDLVRLQSSKLNAIYCYAGAGNLESSKDVMFSGACIIAENSEILKESRFFNLKGNFIFADVDVDKITNERIKNKTFAQEADVNFLVSKIEFETYQLTELKREYSGKPFIPKDKTTLYDILEIQSTALARRLISSKSKKMVLGLSGGLDSTLALLVCLESIKKINWNLKDIVAISMPGPGTSNRTKKQARDLANLFSIDFSEIPIIDAVELHMKDIKHSTIDTTYENIQARERTQILFNIANQNGGIVIGTGDLSEISQGFMTVIGDHAAGYSVNCGVPKTLVKELVKFYAEEFLSKKESDVLFKILETKISPELLPPDKNGEIAQSTEEILGSYDYIDFFLYHMVRNNFSKEKILFLAKRIFGSNVEKYIDPFYKRFQANQFKRTFTPAGIMVGSVSLSSRGFFRCPDESEGF